MSELIPYLQAPFLPVWPDQLAAAGVKRLAVNLTDYERQPGMGVLATSGGLKQWLNWSGDLVTFVGDFGPLAKVKKNLVTVGVHYQQSQTQAKLTMTPEQAVEWQAAAQADWPVALFQGADYYAPVDDLERATEANRTWREAQPDSWLQPVLGGGLKALRQTSLAGVPAGSRVLIANLPPASEPEEWRRIVALTKDLLAPEQPTAVVAPDLTTIKIAKELAIDWIISPWPIKAGMAGHALVDGAEVNVKHQEFADQVQPLSTDCSCPLCAAGFTRATVHAQLHQNLPLATEGLILHNLAQLNQP